ncbi:MAG TPA: ribosome small subunit-dependent GTPase A, partial [Tepidisphaeraceae bacterium]
MSERRRKKGPREKDLTGRYFSGDMDEDRIDPGQRFSQRNKDAQQNKILRTTALRAGEQEAADVAGLPVGQVIQVFSLYYEVQQENKTLLCTVRKTLNKVAETSIVVGDFVRFRESGVTNEANQPEAIIESILPRKTVLTRTESFKGVDQHPIVANADQMLIVASLRDPAVKWGLIDRMLIAAESGGLAPIICLNKMDLPEDAEDEDGVRAADALRHYSRLGIRSLQTSVEQRIGLDELRGLLKDKITVLAGHSGVGKSSLIRSIQPSLDLRIGDVSAFTNKGRHTTSSARRYPLDFGG